ncbi:MAG: helix-turn-helix domain-containing protein [Firmicutes bacterium]|nr:helix-turn-helix domain-containing protein [Bacillota bacterium]
MQEQIIKRLIAIRKRAGLSAKELGLQINRGDCYISHVERGKHFPTVDALKEILNACGSSMVELFYHDFDHYQNDMELLESMKSMDSRSKEALSLFFRKLHDDAKAV